RASCRDESEHRSDRQHTPDSPPSGHTTQPHLFLLEGSPSAENSNEAGGADARRMWIRLQAAGRLMTPVSSRTGRIGWAMSRQRARVDPGEDDRNVMKRHRG